MTPEEYIRLENRLRECIEIAFRATENYVPEKVRPLRSWDIYVGNIVFGKNQNGWYWHQIKEVHNCHSEYKAYTASDGCRYGLSDHFVRDESQDNHKTHPKSTANDPPR